MLTDNTILKTINQNLTKYIIGPIAEAADKEIDMGHVRTKEVKQIKEVKFSYPKNGLYGLL